MFWEYIVFHWLVYFSEEEYFLQCKYINSLLNIFFVISSKVLNEDKIFRLYCISLDYCFMKNKILRNVRTNRVHEKKLV